MSSYKLEKIKKYFIQNLFKKFITFNKVSYFVEILCPKLISRQVTIRSNFLTCSHIYRICFPQLLDRTIKRSIIDISTDYEPGSLIIAFIFKDLLNANQ